VRHEIDTQRRESGWLSVAGYNSSLPLIIDPVVVYSTYLGGSNTNDDAGIAADVAATPNPLTFQLPPMRPHSSRESAI
jgi:hypothetical protein